MLRVLMVAVVVAAVVASVADGQTTLRSLRASGSGVLTGANEVPPVVTSARGVAVLSYDDMSGALTYSIESNVTSKVTGVHLHLSGTSEKLFLSTTGWGVAKGLDPKWGAALLAGNTYINVHTVDFPSGEVRGDIVTAASSSGAAGSVWHGAVVADDVYETERVPAAASDSARAVVSLEYDASVGELSFVAATNMPGLTGVHVHLGGLGTDGSNLCDFGAALDGVCSGLDNSTFLMGGYYFNFHVGTPGYMRGQVFPLETSTVAQRPVFAGKLVDTGVASYVTGVVVGTWDEMDQVLNVQVWHNATAALAVSLGTDILCTGAVDCASPVAASLPGPFNLTARDELFGSPGKQVQVATAGGIVMAGYMTYGSVTWNGGSPISVPRFAAYMTGYEATLSEPTPVASGVTLLEFNAAGTMATVTALYATNETDPVTVVFGSGAWLGQPAVGETVLGVGPGSGCVEGTVPLANLGGDLDKLDGQAAVMLRTTTFPTGSGAGRGNVGFVRKAAPAAVTHVATLDNTQEVPPSTSTGAGVGVAVFNPLDLTVTYRVAWAFVGDTVTEVHLHVGARGSNGPKLFVLATAPAGNGIQGTTPPLSRADAAAFVADGCYFNVHGTGGVSLIRGQIEARPFTSAAMPHRWEVYATFGTSVPSVATGLDLAVVEFEEELFSSTSYADVSMLNVGTVPDSVTLNGPGPAWTNSAVLSTVCAGCSGGWTHLTKMPVSRTAAVAARTGVTYMAVNSAGGGDQRGMLSELAPVAAPVVPAATLSWVVDLSGAAEDPPVTTAHSGLAALRWDPATLTLSYTIWHDVDDVLYVHLHEPTGGPAAYVLAADAAASVSPIVGSIVVAPSHVCMLTSGSMYINLHSTTVPSGELRGNVMASAYTHGVFHAVGGQEVPPVLAARGGAMGITVAGGSLSARVLHNIGADITKIHLHNGPAGANGPLVFDLGPLALSLDSPFFVSGVSVSPAYESALQAGEFYLNLHSWLIPSGEARGQVLPITLPTPMCPPGPSPSPPPPPVAVTPSPPPPPAGSSATLAPNDDDEGVFKQDNYILAGAAAGGLILGICITAITCKLCCKSKRSKRNRASTYDLGGGSSLMTI